MVLNKEPNKIIKVIKLIRRRLNTIIDERERVKNGMLVLKMKI